MKTFSTGLLIAGVSLMTMAACDTSTTPGVPDIEASTPLGAWELQRFETAAGIVVAPDPSSYTIEFRTDGRAHARADCNVCNGSYEVDGANLSLGPMGCTLAACPPGSLFDTYQRALSSTSSFERSGSELALAYESGVMRFRAQ